MDNNNKIQELPMNWWNFWKYFRFPVGILISIGVLAQYGEMDFNSLSTFGGILVIVHIALFVLLCSTYIIFLTKKPQAYNLLITYLFLDSAWNAFISTVNNNSLTIAGDISQSVITFLISYVIICGVWVYPNYIYFKKRKEFFYENEEYQIQYEKQEDEHLKNLINNIESTEKIANETLSQNTKSEKDKKHCAICGKEINQNWDFCNYCGNKLK